MSKDYFDEQAYLARYPDVAAAVEAGHYTTGYGHYVFCGRREGRFSPIPAIRQEENRKFFLEIVDKIEGWLVEYAALVTMCLLDTQSQREISGSLIEIGVFKGRYFSLILRAAGESSEIALGIDNFGFVPEATVRAILSERMPSARYQFISRPSSSLTGDELLAELGGVKPRFVGVDGSHECDDVILDLMLAEEILCSDGFVAVDDFMSVVNVGVNEGVHRFFSQKRRLVPFAFLMNKLFLCRPHVHHLYANVVESYVEGNTGNQHSDQFVKNRNRYRSAVEQKLWGQNVITVW